MCYRWEMSDNEKTQLEPMTRYKYTFKASRDLLQHEAIARDLYGKLHPEVARIAGIPLRYGTDITPGRQQGEYFPYSDEKSSMTKRTDLLTVSFDSKADPGVVQIDSTSLTAEQIHRVLTS